ncbi:Uncharacterized protein SCF082_LOCUS33291 [Durusdinium trenchii]|uniref:Uncharacterized protein n=1 Tax=Durusdinium trenchii TaxID=1381693 RepID=A0ABP0NLW8_9DINO
MVPYAEALHARSAELRRKAQEQRQTQDRVREEISSKEKEVANLRQEALRLQLEAEEHRQELKEQRSGKRSNSGALQKEVDHRRHQVEILKAELAKQERETKKLVEDSLSEALQVASARDLRSELQWKTELEAELERLRNTEVESRRLEKEVKQLEKDISSSRGRAATIQLLVVLDDLRLKKEVAQRQEAFRLRERELQDSWTRRLEEKDEHLASLAVDSAVQRRCLEEEISAAEEEALQAEKELHERLARNQRRVDRAESQLAKYKAKVDVGKGKEVIPTLPSLTSVPRPSMSEFAVVGALKALDEMGQRSADRRGTERLGLLRPA